MFTQTGRRTDKGWRGMRSALHQRKDPGRTKEDDRRMVWGSSSPLPPQRTKEKERALGWDCPHQQLLSPFLLFSTIRGISPFIFNTPFLAMLVNLIVGLSKLVCSNLLLLLEPLPLPKLLSLPLPLLPSCRKIPFPLSASPPPTLSRRSHCTSRRLYGRRRVLISSAQKIYHLRPAVLGLK